MSYHRHLRRGAIEEEDATTLKLGSDFQNESCLFVSEVRILLEAQMGAKHDKTDNSPITTVLQKTLTYVQNFSSFTNKDSVKAVRERLSTTDQLEHFEISQLANLCCEEAEEAKALIPSLANKIDDETLQDLLNEILTLKKFQD